MLGFGRHQDLWYSAMCWLWVYLLGTSCVRYHQLRTSVLVDYETTDSCCVTCLRMTGFPFTWTLIRIALYIIFHGTYVAGMSLTQKYVQEIDRR